MPAVKLKCWDVNINKHQDMTQGLGGVLFTNIEQGSARLSLVSLRLQEVKAEVQIFVFSPE